MTKPESEWKLEDWVLHHSCGCRCTGTFKCSACTIKELQEQHWQEVRALENSWQATMRMEKEIYKALNERFARCQKALSDAHRAT